MPCVLLSGWLQADAEICEAKSLRVERLYRLEGDVMESVHCCGVRIGLLVWNERSTEGAVAGDVCSV